MFGFIKTTSPHNLLKVKYIGLHLHNTTLNYFIRFAPDLVPMELFKKHDLLSQHTVRNVINILLLKLFNN